MKLATIILGLSSLHGYIRSASASLQYSVDGDYLGRTFGVFGMIATSMMPIGMLIFGPMADVVKVEWILLGTGVLMILLGRLLGRNKVPLKAGEPVVVTESSDLTL